MANINENLLVRGARGNVGKQFVYRKHGNSTMIAKMPRISEKTLDTEEQLAAREQFSSAAAYAQTAVKDAELKKEYQKKARPGNTAYNMALRDYLKAPVVKAINTENFNGSAGSTIAVRAKDDFRVVAVRVSIFRDAAGGLLEEGEAVLDPIRRELWTYTVAQAHSTEGGLRIVATATDLPGNKASLEVMIP